MGKNVSLLVPSPHRERHDQYIDKYLKTGKSGIIGRNRELDGLHKNGNVFPISIGISEVDFGEHRYFTYHRRKNGTLYPVEVNLQMTTYDNLPAFVAIILDLTEKQQTEQTLELTRFSIDRAASSIFWIESDGSFFDFNQSAHQHLGYTRSEMLQMNVSDIKLDFPPQRWADHWQEIKKIGSLRFESRPLGQG